MTLTVTLTREGSAPEKFTLDDPGHYIIGRAEDAAIPLRDPVVSAEHCVIILDNGKAIVRDLMSTNGTLVDGAALGGEILNRAAERNRELQATLQLTPTDAMREATRNEVPLFNGSVIQIADNRLRVKIS